ncbi:MAG: pilus assembly PilX N-terminal domain-containing protein [Spirochaetales bacterium]|jgi:hypothetical protein|nr:pilus assembly PilX N-terminal domain-containing protein [Spirochaetales bacterium]
MIKKTIKNEQGFVLITSLLMLTVLMIIGIAATNTTTIELQISGNDKVAKQTFYQAEAGTQVGSELVEDNIDKVGFAATDIGLVHINTLDFYLNEKTATPIDWSTDIDAYLPNSAASNILPRTDLIFRGETEITPGSAIQMVAGYEGKGKAAASGGAVRKFDIRSRHSGNVNSESTIVIEWNHRM